MDIKWRRYFSFFVLFLFAVACSDSGTGPAQSDENQGSSLQESGTAGQVVEGQYIVQLRASEDPVSVSEELADALGGEVFAVYEHAIKGFAVKGIDQEVASAMDDDPRVLRVEPDVTVEAFQQTLPTGVDRIETDKNPIADIDGQDDQRVDSDIAIIDTGIDVDHRDLNVVDGTNCVGGSPCTGNGDDNQGHGTHVAGTAAAIDNGVDVVGVAPGARLWAVKVLDSSGRGLLSWIIAGIDWVTARSGQIDVANMSLGGVFFSQSLRDAITNSVNAGIVYVVAAGNSSRDVYGPDQTFGTSDDTSPASLPEVATISSLTDTDGEPGGNGGPDPGFGDADDTWTDPFSNFSCCVVGNNPVSMNHGGKAIDLVLPGVHILSTRMGGGTEFLSGTSMATPHAAGLAALYIVANSLSLDEGSGAQQVPQIRQGLIDAGRDQSDPNDGLVQMDDPDGNFERIGWAEDITPPQNNPPTVAWDNPTDGETVSGDVPIRISASDNEDAPADLTVEWRVDGGNWQSATFNPNTGQFEASWDSRNVSDGDHTLEARATDTDGATDNQQITVTVANANAPPTVSWDNPSDGDMVSGDVPIRIDASDNEDAPQDLTVEWRVDGGPWQPTTYNSNTGQFEATWDTRQAPSGQRSLEARATDTDGATDTDQIQVVVNQPPSVAWANPSDGDLVDGTVPIRIDASDKEDDPQDLTVEWRLNEGDWRSATFNPETGQFEASWDTGPVPGGRHTLEARATDTGGLQDTDQIEVIKNTPPNISWEDPENGDIFVGPKDIVLEATDREDPNEDLTVQWRVGNGPWRTAKFNPSTGLFESSWYKTSPGARILTARAIDTFGEMDVARIRVGR